MFSLELPHQGDSNEFTQYTIYIYSFAWIVLEGTGFFPSKTFLKIFVCIQDRSRFLGVFRKVKVIAEFHSNSLSTRDEKRLNLQTV